MQLTESAKLDIAVDRMIEAARRGEISEVPEGASFADCTEWMGVMFGSHSRVEPIRWPEEIDTHELEASLSALRALREEMEHESKAD